MRRIGLTVGVLGALVGAYAAFWLWSSVADQRKSQAEFDSLLNLPVIQAIATDIVKEKTTNTYAQIEGHPKGIKQIRVNGNSEIDWFEMDDGRLVTNVHAPSRLWYLLSPAIIALGFLTPWGAVRLIAWIISGFISSNP